MSLAPQRLALLFLSASTNDRELFFTAVRQLPLGDQKTVIETAERLGEWSKTLRNLDPQLRA